MLETFCDGCIQLRPTVMYVPRQGWLCRCCEYSGRRAAVTPRT